MDNRKEKIRIIIWTALLILLLLSLLRSYVFPLDIRDPEYFRDKAFLVLIGATVVSAGFMLLSFERSKVLNLCIALSFCPIILLYFSDIKYETIDRLGFVPLTLALIAMLVKRRANKRAAEPLASATTNEADSEVSEQKGQGTSNGEKSRYSIVDKKKRIAIIALIVLQILLLLYLQFSYGFLLYIR